LDNRLRRKIWKNDNFIPTLMSQLIFSVLFSTPAPTAPIVAIAFIALFALVGIMLDPDQRE